VIYTAPDRPLTALPDPINKAPLFPEVDFPVLSTTKPLTPFKTESAVLRIKLPLLDLVPVDPTPVTTDILPPLDAVEAPADITISPPIPLLPVPTVTYTAPPLPLDAAPEPMYNAPVFPDPDVPVLKINIPLTPLLVASPVLSTKSPLLLPSIFVPV
jgi:hypothetical protein